MAPFIGYFSADQLICVLAPTDGNCCRTECIFKNKGPTDDPGHYFAHCCIRVSICAAGDGYNGSKFRITQACKSAAHSSNNKRDGNCRACETACSCRSADKETRTNNS